MSPWLPHEPIQLQPRMQTRRTRPPRWIPDPFNIRICNDWYCWRIGEIVEKRQVKLNRDSGKKRYIDPYGRGTQL